MTNIALSLCAGVARGRAHIHAIRAFEELGVTPVHIAGTPIGAVSYSGMSADEMKVHVDSSFGSSGYISLLNNNWRHAMSHSIIRHFAKLFRLLLLASLLANCTSHDRTEATPTSANYQKFSPVGVPLDIRTFGDVSDVNEDEFVAEFLSVFTRPGKTGGLNILALSGGGPDGAYGAGVLNGWTATGKRPEFDIVTGISTGAIIAPFAFLGSEYDGALRRFYTTTDTSRVARFRVIPAVIGGGALADNAPLERAIAQELTDQIISKIGEEHVKGRRLIIGTTNIDAERPVLWDIGELASANTPEAFALIRKIVLASAAIPVFLKPVRIPVTDGVSTKEELHVDGALTQQIFAYPANLPMKRALAEAGLAGQTNQIWVIHNKRLEPRFEAQSTSLIKMANRTLSILIRSQGLGDLAFIIALAKRDGLVISGLAVPARFSDSPTQAFDPAYMTKLYNIGLTDGSSVNSWNANLQEQLLGN